MITIYGAPGCAYCTKCAKLADTFELEYKYKSILEHPEEFLELFPEIPGVPQIVWGDRKISGYPDFAQAVNDNINDGETI